MALLSRSLKARVERRNLKLSIKSVIFVLSSFLSAFKLERRKFEGVYSKTQKNYLQQVFERLKINLFLRMEPDAYFALGICFKNSDIKQLQYFLSTRQCANINTYLLQKTASDELIETVNNKKRFEQFCKQNDITVPEVYAEFLPSEISQSDVEKTLTFFINEKPRIFVKPEDGYQGVGAALILKTGQGWSVTDNNARYDYTSEQEVLDYVKKINPARGEKIIFQEFVNNHPSLASLCDTALLTIRMITANVNDEIRPLLAMLKINENGKITDNCGENRFFVNINLETGALIRGAKFYNGTQAIETASITTDFQGRPFSGQVLPFFQQAVDMGIRLHTLLDDFVTMAHDIAITSDGAVMIEANLVWDAMPYQNSSGVGILKTKYLDCLQQYLMD